MQPWAPSGLSHVPQLRWGAHLAQLFDTGEELGEVLAPYFKAGLENNEQCLWVTGAEFGVEAARSVLRTMVPDLDKREKAKQIEIVDGAQWYAASDKLAPDELIAGLLQREQEALERGYAGQRTSGNCAWVGHDQWEDFLDYEALVQHHAPERRLICMCSYRTDKLHYQAQSEVTARHDLVLACTRRARPRMDDGPTLDTRRRDSEADLLAALQRQQRTFDLAMAASDMGTWRFTIADNVCVYDENAQRLYGLRQAHFLHDEIGVKDKFHPDDLDLMWSRVAKALDPQGDGRYDVEYRVKQTDGSWRWLSAWGLVEFEGDGAARTPVAIAGASRDLTQQKHADELQRLLLNELNHRVKNTVATIQALTSQTLRCAQDLPSARAALDRRIQALAKAHEVLTARAWTSANLADVVARALDAFSSAQVEISGPALEVSPKHALGVSLALHELATNAVKYGALSNADGRVRVGWRAEDTILLLDWEESDGPPVAPPRRKGFGSRLLEDLIARDLDGETLLTYAASGVRCTITATL